MKHITKLFLGFLSVFVFGFVFIGQVFAANLNLRVETPKTPINQDNFKLNFVALDITNKTVTIKCFKKGPSDGGFVQFGADQNLAAGGNSGNCDVTSAVLNANGTYLFKVSAATDAESVESPESTVDYLGGAPGTPYNYSKEKITDCEYKIKFKTAADNGKTTKVEIYRSDQTSFTADPGTKVGEVGIGSDLEGSFSNTVPDCNRTFYFAIRAFDSAGNGSGVVGDSVVKVKVVNPTTTTTTTTTAAAAGAIPVAQSALAPGGEVLGEQAQTVSPSPSASGAVLGEFAKAEKETGLAGSFKNLLNLRNALIALVVALFIGGNYYLYRKLKQ